VRGHWTPMGEEQWMDRWIMDMGVSTDTSKTFISNITGNLE